MAGTFHLDSVGLDPLSDLHNQVAAELAQLTGADAPQASDVASSFGTIAANVNASLDGALQSRTGTIQTTQRSSDTISGLLKKAHHMYTGTDQEGADNIRSTARAFGDQPGGQPDSGAQRVKQAGDADPAGSPTGNDATTAAVSGSSGSPNSPTTSGVPRGSSVGRREARRVGRREARRVGRREARRVRRREARRVGRRPGARPARRWRRGHPPPQAWPARR